MSKLLQNMEEAKELQLWNWRWPLSYFCYPQQLENWPRSAKIFREISNFFIFNKIFIFWFIYVE